MDNSKSISVFSAGSMSELRFREVFNTTNMESLMVDRQFCRISEGIYHVSLHLIHAKALRDWLNEAISKHEK